VALVLAIDSALTHHDALQRLADDLAAHEIVFASSCDEALAIIGRQIPDLILFPVFCSDGDEARIIARVDALPDADDPRTLAIPLLASTVVETPATPARWFYWFKPQGETAEGDRDAGAFADEIRDYLATGPDDLSTGLFQEFSTPADNSLAERVAAAVPAAARAILARLSELRPERPLVLRERISPPGWRRSVRAALLLAAAVPAAARAILARLSRVKSEHPTGPRQRISPPRWLRTVGAAPLLAVAAAARPILARLSGLRLEYPLVRRQRVPPPRWRRSVGTALLLVLALTTATGLTRRVEWFTATPERAPAVAGRQPAKAGGGIPANGKKMNPTRKTGRLSVTSTPEGATVSVDGRKRGVTPLVLDDLVAGRHAVTLESAGGTIQRSIDVKADQTATVEASIYPGWLALFAPIEVEIQAHGRVLQFDERHQTLLPPGRHEIVVVSRELGYRDSRVVDVKPGEVTRLSIEPPKTTLTVTAMAPAQVWLDGTHIGAAPLVDVPIDLGTHQLVVRHPTAGEERRTIAATSAPVRVQVDFGNQN
jgi:CheY-like chemotaxis protein